MKTVIKAFVAAMVFVVVGVMALVIFSDTEFETEIGTAKVSWLPAEAINVSRKSRDGFGGMEFIECTISEAQFRILASQKKWALTEISDKHVYGRIEGLAPLRNLPDLGSIDMIQNGLFSESRTSNGGGYTVFYDLALERMIYSWSHR